MDNDFMKYAFASMMNDPIMRDIVAVNMLQDKDKENDVMAYGLLTQDYLKPNYMKPTYVGTTTMFRR